MDGQSSVPTATFDVFARPMLIDPKLACYYLIEIMDLSIEVIEIDRFIAESDNLRSQPESAGCSRRCTRRVTRSSRIVPHCLTVCFTL